MDDKQRIKAACVVVGCKEKDLLVGRVAGDVVVLVVGPVGHKYVVPFSDLGVPPPVTTVVEGEAPVTASKKRTRKRPAKKA